MKHKCNKLILSYTHWVGAYNVYARIGIGPWSSGRRSPGPMNPIFFYITWTAMYMCHLLGELKAQECTMEWWQAVVGSVIRKLWVQPFMWT